MKHYKYYKDSGLEWLGPIPEHWEVKKLKHVTQINPAKDAAINKDSTELVVFLPMEKVKENGEIDCELMKPISDLWNGFTFFKRNDVIVAKITPCFENGKGALLNKLTTEIGFGSTEFHVLRAKESILPEFLYFITKSEIFMKIGEAFMSGAAGQKRVPTDFISEFNFAVPSLPEQTAIADFLDRKTAELDSLIDKKQRLIRLYEEEKAALINKAVTRGLDPQVSLKPSGIEWLGQIPAHWEVKKLKWVLTICSGDGIKSEQIKPEGTCPVYGGNGIMGYTENFNSEKIDVIIGRVGAKCGNVRLVSGKKWISDNALVAQIKPGFDIAFISILLEALNLNNMANQNAQPLITGRMVKEKKIILPPFSEQTAIVAHIEHECARIDRIIAKFRKQIELFKEYRAALISEVVTGKIDVRQV